MAGPSSSAAKLKVFISYSRRDRAFAEKLLAALEARGLDVLIDRRDLPIYFMRVEIKIVSGADGFQDCVRKICFR